MRLRHVVQALLRHRRIDERETSYHDVVWENAMEAYESTPDPEPEISPVVEITPYIQARLDAAKEELLLKAHRTKRQGDIRRRERRRRIGIATTAALAMLVTVGGAGALTGTRTGIQAIDEFLNIDQEKRAQNDVPAPAHAPPTDVMAVAPEGPVIPLAVEFPGVGRVISSAYLSRTGHLCFAIVRVFSDEDVPPPGGGGCGLPGPIFTRAARDVAFVGGTDTQDAIIVTGYASRAVKSLEIRGVGGQLDVDLGHPLTLDESGDSSIRPFLGALIPTEKLSYLAGSGLALDPRNYELMATLEDGREVRIPSAISLTGTNNPD